MFQRLRAMRDSGWPGVVTLAVGIFVMVTVEELPIGTLTLISKDLGAAEGAVGLGVTGAGLVAGLMGVSTSLVIGHLDRRLVLASALGVVAATTFATGLAPNIVVYIVARLLVGLGIGVFWSLIAIVAARIVRRDQQALAVTVAFTGASGATILGVPFGTWLGAQFGWSEAFFTLAGICLLTALLVFVLVPKVRTTQKIKLSQYRAAWAVPSVRLALIVTAVMVTAHFSAYTYASPALQQFGGVSVKGVGAMLLLMGIAGLVGNLASAPIMRARPMLALLLVTTGMLVGVILVMLSKGAVTAAIAMGIWGLFGGAMAVVLQHWVLTSAGDDAEPAAALDSGIFNSAIAGGAALGAAVISLANVTAVYAVAAVGMALSTTLVLRFRQQVQREAS